MSRLFRNQSGHASATFGLNTTPSRIDLPGNEGPSIKVYTVTFLGDGLASGAQFCVKFGVSNLCSANSSTVTFYGTPNGTYTYSITLASGTSGYTISPSSGNVTVNGANVTVDITFTPIAPVTYSVTFNESGLSGQSWSVTLNGTQKSGTGTSIEFTGLSNGTYPFTITAPSGYTASPASGNITVNGDNVIESIVFSAPTVPLIYVINQESGTQGGTLQAIDTSTMTVYKTATDSTTIGALGFDGTYIYAADGTTMYKYKQDLSLVGSSPISFAGFPVVMSYDGTNLLVGDSSGTVYLVSTSTISVITYNDLATDEGVTLGLYQGITYTGTYWFVAMNGGTDLASSYIFLLDDTTLGVVQSVSI